MRGGEGTARHQSGQEIPVEAVSVSWPTAADTWTLIFLIDIQERKRAEARMMTNERRLRSIFETAAEGIWLADPEGNTVMVNPRMAQILGCTPEEMLGRPFSDFVHPDDLAKAHQGFRLRKAGDQAPKEYRMRRKDGTVVSVVVTASAIRDEEGRLTGVAALLTDVTEIRRAERERAEAREQLYRVLENMADGFVILDREWRFVYMNAAAERIGGQNRKDVLGCSLWELYPDLVASKLHDELALAVTLQQVREFEFYCRPLDLWAVFRCFPAAGGGLAIYLRDITKLKDAERERARREQMEAELQQHARLLDLSHEPILAWSADGAIRFWNRGAELLYGWTRKEALGKNVHELLQTQDPPGLEEIERRTAETGSWVGEVQHRTRDGRWITVESRREIFKQADGSILILATNHDVTKRKAVEQELRRINAALQKANEALGQFAYVAAHDLQEPARSVALYADLLERRGAGDSQFGEWLRQMAIDARRMQALIQDLLAYTQAVELAEGEQLEADANAALQQAKDNLRGAIQESGAHIDSQPLPKLAMRQAQLTEVFQNLISNAIKYRSAASPSIHIEATRVGAEWRFAVRDNGMGIPAEHHQRIFRVFKRLHGRDIPGTGIGLAICERIVSHYGGRIWVESAPGQGATFYFTLPAIE